MAGVFICYRRDDSQGFAGRLADDLTEILGTDLVFRDVEIPAGEDYTEVLQRAVAASDVLIVVIGRNWQAVSTSGNRSRLFEPADWVRAEIEAAFAQGKQVIPVLVAGAKMCRASDLPESITHLASIQAFIMTDRKWDDDIKSLAQLLRKAVPALKAGASQKQQISVESPAQVLRELGNRVHDEVDQQGHRRGRSGYIKPIWRWPLTLGIRRFLKKSLITLSLFALIYIGIQLFGDTEALQLLDKLEARLQIGWSRFLNYLNSLK